MKADKKQARHRAITQAAYDLLARKGYDGASMLSIAKAARASNETLYRWYGDKRGLFEAMVRDNADHTKTMLEQAIAGQDDPQRTLARISPVFLSMLLGEPAILLNRAAAAEPSGELGAAISAGGRDVIQPLIRKLMCGFPAEAAGDAQERAGWYLGLLVGDLQVKRVIGVLPEPTEAEIADRCRRALAAFHRLLGGLDT